MNTALLAYTYSFAAVLTFSTASIGFTYFASRVSPLWMNVFKALVSTLCCLPVLWFLDEPFWLGLEQAWPFFLSGVIGLNGADWLILAAYKRMGPGRTLVVFGFQPFFLGTAAYLLWGEEIFPIQFLAIFFFLICLFLFSYERFRKSGQWEVQGLLLALGGVFLDAVGVLLTRHGFNMNPEVSGIGVHYFRGLAALLSFAVYLPFLKIGLWEGFKKLSVRERSIASLSAFSGTFLCLVFYMQAVKIGRLAMVSAIVLTDPVVSTFFEHLWLRIWPSRYLWLALLSFFCAMVCLFYPQFG